MVQRSRAPSRLCKYGFKFPSAVRQEVQNSRPNYGKPNKISGFADVFPASRVRGSAMPLDTYYALRSMGLGRVLRECIYRYAPRSFGLRMGGVWGSCCETSCSQQHSRRKDYIPVANDGLESWLAQSYRVWKTPSFSWSQNEHHKRLVKRRNAI